MLRKTLAQDGSIPIPQDRDETLSPPPADVAANRRGLGMWLAVAVITAGELALFSWHSVAARDFAYQVIRLPLLKLALLCGFVIFVAVVFAARAPRLPRPRLGPSLYLHLASVALLWLGLKPLLLFTLRSPAWQGVTLWCLCAGGVGLSWLSALLPWRQWVGLLRRYWPVVLAAYLFLSLEQVVRESSWNSRLVNGSIFLCEKLLSLAFDTVIVDPTKALLGVPGFQVEIGYHCSGYEGIVLITLFLGLYLYLRRADLIFPRALWVLPIGVLTSWLANGVRLAVLIAIGAWISPDIALDGFHSRAGWIAFVVIGLMFILAIEKLRVFHRRKGETYEFPALPYILPLMGQLFLILVFAAFSDGFDLFYPVRLVLVGTILYCFRKAFTRLQLWRGPDLRALALGVAVYLIWIALVPQVESQDPRLVLHTELAAIWLLSRLVGSVVVVPIVEELAFRGYLLRRLQRRDFEAVPVGSLTAASVLGSSLAFGCLHDAWFAGLLAGTAYAYATTIRGRLSDCIIAHAVTNLCIALHVILFDRWDLWI